LFLSFLQTTGTEIGVACFVPFSQALKSRARVEQHEGPMAVLGHRLDTQNNVCMLSLCGGNVSSLRLECQLSTNVAKHIVVVYTLP